MKVGQVKVFVDYLYQNLFFNAKFFEEKVGTKWYKICTARISILWIPRVTLVLLQYLFEFKINY